MELTELKQKVLSNSLDSSPLIFVYSDTPYICFEYANAIANNKNLTKVTIEKISDAGETDALFDSQPSQLFILICDDFTENITNNNKNVIVICKKISTNTNIEVIKFPKLLAWQIEDYVKARVPGLGEAEIKWLCEITQYNVYRLDQECKKLELFPSATQKLIFQQINSDDGYSDLTPLTIFNFTNAIIKTDLTTLKDILSDLNTIDVEGTGVVTILLKQFKNIIDVQMNPRNTAETLHMTERQFKAIKYNCGKFTDNQLVNIYEFLTSIDYRVKQGELTFYDNATHLTNNNALVDYLTVSLLNLCR